ncbi:cupin domain-containing protein [Salibacterium aidingense]|uniref:cupin domain-containing protein n=1 Tax=Salibacterium aidingense TaxID=384933 RepID=UPI003BB9AFC0
MEATEIFTPERGGERRAIYFQNPGLKDREPWGWGPATQNIYAAVQLILPGEEAPSHRHTQSALRFIVNGEGAILLLMGNECLWKKEISLLRTPQGMWHDHGHEGKEPMFWLDILDIFLSYMRRGAHFLRVIRREWNQQFILTIIPVNIIKGDWFVRYTIENRKKHR